MAVLILLFKALFFFADGGYPDFNRVDQDGQHDPAVLPDRRRLRLLALRGGGPGPGPRGGRRGRRVHVHGLLLERAVPDRGDRVRADRRRRRGRRRCCTASSGPKAAARQTDAVTPAAEAAPPAEPALTPPGPCAANRNAPAVGRGVVVCGSGRTRLLRRRPSSPWARPWRSPCAALAVGRLLRGGRPPWRPASWRRPSPGPSSRPPWPRPCVASAAALAAAALAAAASARAVLLSAARALPAAVWAPLALSALPAAMRALAAFAAAALPVVLTTRPPTWTWAPPRAALTLRVRRDLRRAAAFGWMAPALAARSSALSASRRAALASSPHRPARTRPGRAFATYVFAALRRGWRTSRRLAA